MIDCLYISFLKKVSKAHKLLGWRGGCDCEVWRDGNKICISIEVNPKRKRPNKTTLEKIRKLFGFDNIEFFKKDEIEDRDFIVIEKELLGEQQDKERGETN